MVWRYVSIVFHNQNAPIADSARPTLRQLILESCAGKPIACWRPQRSFQVQVANQIVNVVLVAKLMATRIII